MQKFLIGYFDFLSIYFEVLFQICLRLFFICLLSSLLLAQILQNSLLSEKFALFSHVFILCIGFLASSLLIAEFTQAKLKKDTSSQ